MPHTHYWTEAKIKRFVDAWNDRVPKTALSERFACKNPSAMAAHLRKRGFILESRLPNDPRF